MKPEHQWLFLHSLESVATVRRLVAFDVKEHTHVLPHSAFRGQTPDEMYFGTGDASPANLTALGAAARRVRVEAKPIGGLWEVPIHRRGGLITDSRPTRTRDP